jgi:hypothetical protein
MRRPVPWSAELRSAKGKIMKISARYTTDRGDHIRLMVDEDPSTELNFVASEDTDEWADFAAWLIAAGSDPVQNADLMKRMRQNKGQWCDLEVVTGALGAAG